MIIQLVLGFLVAQCYGRSDLEIKGWFFSLAVVCNKDFNISNEALQMMKDHKLPDNDNAKCLMNCVYKKADLVDDKGNYDSAKTNNWITNEFSDDAKRLENAKNLFDICKKVNDEPVSDGDKGCERAYLLSKCLLENAPKVGFPLQ